MAHMDKPMSPGAIEDYLRVLGHDEIDKAFPDGSFPMPKQLIDFENEIRSMSKRQLSSVLPIYQFEDWSTYMYMYFVTAEKLRRLEAECAKLRFRDYPTLRSNAL